MSVKSQCSRREFLARVGAAGLVAPAVSITEALAQQPPRPASSVLVGRPPKSVIRQSDFRYAGSFKLPLSIGGSSDPRFGMCLAHRYVNGQLRFFVKAHGYPNIEYEVAHPGLTDDPSTAKVASVVKVWGDIPGSDNYGQTYGLFWDEADQLLYYTTGKTYNATSPFDPCVGAVSLNDTTGAITRHGVWGLTGRSCKMAMGGLLEIPKWFSDIYCPGRRFGAGFGGHFSVATSGPVSSGPALAAFNPNDLKSAASRSSVGNTVLVGYPFNGAAYTSPDRCHRDMDYNTEHDGWKPRNGIGYWAMTDYLWQGGVWVDTPQKSGVLFFPTLANGRTWYQTSTVWADRGSHGWFVYDPTDLGFVARGNKQQWQIQPANSWLVQYPGVTYPLAAWKDEPKEFVVGSAFDAQSQTVYVAIRHALGQGSPIVVYAYDVI